MKLILSKAFILLFFSFACSLGYSQTDLGFCYGTQYFSPINKHSDFFKFKPPVIKGKYGVGGSFVAGIIYSPNASHRFISYLTSGYMYNKGIKSDTLIGGNTYQYRSKYNMIPVTIGADYGLVRFWNMLIFLNAGIGINNVFGIHNIKSINKRTHNYTALQYSYGISIGAELEYDNWIPFLAPATIGFLNIDKTLFVQVSVLVGWPSFATKKK